MNQCLWRIKNLKQFVTFIFNPFTFQSCQQIPIWKKIISILMVANLLLSSVGMSLAQVRRGWTSQNREELERSEKQKSYEVYASLPLTNSLTSQIQRESLQ